MKLSDICDVYSGYAFKTFNDLGHGVPVIKISNLLPDGSIDLVNCLFTTENIKEKFYSKKSDIYIALSGATTGKISIMDKDNTFAINQRVGIVRNRSTIPNEYLKYFLRSKSNRILEEASGCAQPNISPKQIANYVVPIFSADEMNRIVSELREIDKIKSTYHEQLELLDELVRARFVEMFGDPRINDKKWKAGKIVDYFEVKGGKRIPKGMGYAERKTNHPYLRASDMKNATILDDDIHYIDEEVYKRIKRYTVNAHGIYLTNVGVNLGMAGVIPKKYDGANLTENAVKLVPKDKILLNGMFLSYYINSPGIQHYINERKMSVGVPKLAIFRIESMPLLLPPLELQNQFASFVQEVDKSRSRIQKSLEASQELFDSLMQEYFG